MQLARRAAPLVVGPAAFAAAMAAGVVLLYAVYIPAHLARAPHAPALLRRLVVYGATALVVGGALAVLFGLPIVVARRWHFNALLSVVIAAAIMGITAHYALQTLSVINDCEYGHAFPLDVAGCD